MLTIPAEHNAVRLAATLDYLNTGAGFPELRLYSGTRPALGDDPTDGGLLVAIPLPNPVGELQDSLLVLFQSEDAMVAGDGTATWGRLISAGGLLVADGDVSAPGGGGDFIVPNAALYAGGYSRLVSGTLG